MSGGGEVACVTGASGYVASWLVKLLLHRGYTVKATVRHLSDTRRFAHLKALEGAKDRLHLFQANLTEDGSFDSIVDGCTVVFHTAFPAVLCTGDPQAEVIEPAVKSALNILQSCSKATSVKRVIVTSSLAAVNYNWNYQGPDVVVDETWFSDPEFCKENKRWYWLAKTSADKAAWEYAQENGINLVVLHPGFVIGPLLQPTLNTSSRLFLNILDGNQDFPDYQFVDVRDVARAHILAFENPSATGRYILVGTSITHSELHHKLHELYPSLNLPSIGERNSTFQVSKEKAESLGIKFMPLEVSLKDMVESLMQKNFFKLCK
ncbi:Tetraketide alpha-pyrone reductase 1 [Sesamum alatum]|uniref:Dihydroflavonol 4-reductase n=1 Tax=Sesamum alatum TaxID=300844 RepID=A0AAE1Y765_9LAMI|nr:Tetraketide alpha-pyrone reductase 1 [Sesamum alatum]